MNWLSFPSFSFHFLHLDAFTTITASMLRTSLRFTGYLAQRVFLPFFFLIFCPFLSNLLASHLAVAID
jgi:hypothetical protein